MAVETSQTKMHGDTLGQPSHANPDPSHSTHIAFPVNELPSRTEITKDATIFLRSLVTLCRTLLTSATFRILLLDLFAIAREVIDDIAGQVERSAVIVKEIAETVEATAHDVKISAPPDVQPQTICGHGALGCALGQSHLPSVCTSPEKDFSGRLKAKLVGRVQDVSQFSHPEPFALISCPRLFVAHRRTLHRVRLSVSCSRYCGSTLPISRP